MSPVKASFLFAKMQNGLRRNVSPRAIRMEVDRPTSTDVPGEASRPLGVGTWTQESVLGDLRVGKGRGTVLGCRAARAAGRGRHHADPPPGALGAGLASQGNGLTALKLLFWPLDALPFFSTIFPQENIQANFVFSVFFCISKSYKLAIWNTPLTEYLAVSI